MIKAENLDTSINYSICAYSHLFSDFMRQYFRFFRSMAAENSGYPGKSWDLLWYFPGLKSFEKILIILQHLESAGIVLCVDMHTYKRLIKVIVKLYC